jgi:hypothetical protein
MFGLLPIIWLPMDHLISPSLILAKILATHRRPNHALKNWLANFGKAACGHKPNRPLFSMGGSNFLMGLSPAI